MIHSTEDNQIKESELQSIIQSMETIGSKPVPAAPSTKPANSSPPEPKSLSEKIQEQKRKLKQQAPVAKKESKKAAAPALAVPRKNPRRITTGAATQRDFRFSRKGSTKNPDMESGQELQQPSPEHLSRGRPRPQPPTQKARSPTTSGNSAGSYTQKHVEKMRRTQYAIDGRVVAPPAPEEEPRFDLDDYTKTATAFNPSLTQSFFQRNNSVSNRVGVEDVSFTERLLVENSMSNVAKRKGLQIPQRAMSTEERAFSQCTFRPELYKSPQKYSKVQPRLLSHFEQPPVDAKRIPKAEQVMPSLNRSFQSVLMAPLPARINSGGGGAGPRLPSSRRSLCKSIFLRNPKPRQ